MWFGWPGFYLYFVKRPVAGLDYFIFNRGMVYCMPVEALYEEYVFAGTSRKNHTRFYALKCKYHYGNRGYQEKSWDHYIRSDVEKKFTVGSTIKIWVNKKNPREFKVKRYHGMFAYALLLIIGLSCLGAAVKVIEGMF